MKRLMPFCVLLSILAGIVQAQTPNDLLGSSRVYMLSDQASLNPLYQWAVRMDTALLNPNGGKVWYVNAAVSSAGDGKSWTGAKATIASAVALASAGDTILVKGTTFSEAVTVTLAGLRLIGVGTGPDQSTWTGANDTVCLTINATNVLVANIKFRPPAYASGTPAGIALGTSSSYSIIRGCRFQGKLSSYYGIKSAAPGAGNIVIEDCEFIYLNNVTTVSGTAIYGAGTASVACSAWTIRNCTFNSCVKDIIVAGRACLLEGNKHFIVGLRADNTFGSAVTTGTAIDLSGTGTGANVMTKCTLGGTYNLATYTPGATGDVWRGNFASIVSTTAPNGLTVLVPAS